jgi:hypothetical protein
MLHLLLLWRFGPVTGYGLPSLLRSFSEASVEFSKQIQVLQVGCHPHVQPPNLEDQGIPFVWVITFDLSGMGAPASSYTTADIALKII